MDIADIQINIRNLVLQQLLFELNEQYQNQTFEVNTCLRHATEQTLGHSQKLQLKISNQQMDQIRTQLTQFVLALMTAPSQWAQLLKNDQISSKTTQIVINSSETLTNVYRQIIKQTNHSIDQSKSKVKGNKTSDEESQPNKVKLQPFNFQKQYMNSSTKSSLTTLLNTIASQICTFYEQGQKLILAQQKKVEESLKTSQIMNAYYLFGILKQMSSYTYRKLQEAMSQYFKSLPADTIHIFCKYVQKNYEYVSLKCTEEQNKIYNDEQFTTYIEQNNQFWLNFLKQLQGSNSQLKRIESIKGETAVMIVKKIQGEEQFEQAEKLIMKIGKDNKIQVTNSKVSQKKWAIFDMKDSVSGFYKLIKQQLKGQTGQKIQKQVVAYGVPMSQYANLGGSVGKCLANINKYKSANHFFMDLSTNTIIGGSVGYILSEVSILSYFIIAGGLTYTFYHTFSNKATSKLKKLKQLSKTSITAVGAVGSTVAGMMLGQSFIPVPFLGAFVGGVIGGFLGATGTNLMTKLMNKESFKNLINYLLANVSMDGTHWTYSPQIMEKLGVSKKYFAKQICEKQNQRDAYVTAICFCIASFYEAKRYLQRNEQKMKQLQKRQKQHKKSKSKQKIKKDETDNTDNKQLNQLQKLNNNKQKEENKLQLDEDEEFENKFNIVGIVDYLTANNIVLLLQHEKLQKCIRHALT